MAQFNYVVGRTPAFRSEKLGINIPSLWTATVISGLPNGATMNSGSAATENEAKFTLAHKMKTAGYTGTLVRVEDVTFRQEVKTALADNGAVWTEADIQPRVTEAQPKVMARQRKVMAKQAPVTPKQPQTKAKTVTFDCWLDTSRETVKAYKLESGPYVGKSICKFKPTGKKYGTLEYGVLTMPTWLYKKIG
jgi:hypothetical protein